MITSALPPGQTVFITDSSDEVLQPGDPSAGHLCIGGHQVQRLDPGTVVNAEAVVRVKAVVSVPPKYLGLFPLTDFMDGINRY